MYEQPSTEVVELRVTNQLLAGSTAGSNGLESIENDGYTGVDTDPFTWE